MAVGMEARERGIEAEEVAIEADWVVEMEEEKLGELGFGVEAGRAGVEEVLILGRFILILMYWLLMGEVMRRIMRMIWH